MRSALRKAIDGVRWYVRELTDESAYDRYVAHAGANHPHTPTLPARVRADANEPQGEGPPARLPLLLRTQIHTFGSRLQTDIRTGVPLV